MRIGWIGTGIMGAPMLGHLLEAGHECLVFNRTRSKAEALIARGAEWRDSPAEVAETADLVGTMLGYPSDVEEVALGADGLLEAMRPGSVYVDFTTSSPALAERMAAEFAEKGVACLDAPVSGGDVGARNATLSIMVGGDRGAYERILPVLRLLGGTVEFQGGPGAGQHTKMVNQILIASTMMGIREAMRYAEKAGLDMERVLASVGGGAAASWSLANLAPRILAGDFEPGFIVEHFVKDIEIALSEAERMGLELPGLELAGKLYRVLKDEMGKGRAGTQAVYLLPAEKKSR
jgi:3-hydroxyisobutyrate dehydrogenase